MRPVNKLTFKFDGFLSHSSRDKRKVENLANRLKNDGVRIWFAAWEIGAGDDIFLKIEEGLEESRCLILALSSNSLGSDWVVLEKNTVLFRDPANRERRFIPVLIEDCVEMMPSTLRRYRYIDLRRFNERHYRELLEAVSDRR